MSKKSGLFPLLTGVVLGAAAIFLSKKENREKTKKVVEKAVTKAQKLNADYKKNPKKVTAQLERKGKKLATKVVKQAKKELKKKL